MSKNNVISIVNVYQCTNKCCNQRSCQHFFPATMKQKPNHGPVVLLGSLGNTSCANGVVIRTPLHELDWIGNTHAESSMVVWEIKVDPQLSQEHKYGRNGDIDVVWLVGGLDHFLFSIMYGMSSFPLTNSYFSEGYKPPTSVGWCCLKHSRVNVVWYCLKRSRVRLPSHSRATRNLFRGQLPMFGYQDPWKHTN